MRNTKTILYNIAFSLNCLLVFLLIFYSRLQVPQWVQVVGRMHPLVLHFPIVLLVLCVFWEIYLVLRPDNSPLPKNIGDMLLLSASLAGVVTALMGMFLSREEGYETEALNWHKWFGISVSFVLLGWYATRHFLRKKKNWLGATALVSLIAIVVTGHQGANITHGANFLMAPVMKENNQPPVLLEDAMVFADVIHPILQVKCVNCHNQGKSKGELIMETTASLLQGGKHGVLWDTTDNELGLLMHRIHLPDDDKKHMPPTGKTQLTDEEIELLYRWIKGGANFDARLIDLPATDTFRMLATALFEPKGADVFLFTPANDNAISQLNNAYRIVRPIAIGSPALNIAFFGVAQYKTEQLNELLKVKEQVVSLNLAKMPVTDDDLKTIGQMKNLRSLNLSFTKLAGTGLSALAGLKELKELSLSGTTVEAAQIRLLANLPKLTKLLLWKTKVMAPQLAVLQKLLPGVTIDMGFDGRSIVLPLNPPIIENEEVVLSKPVNLQMKHYINGVTMRYTTDGSEPDSLASPVYNGKIMIDDNLVVKARAFKPGWISSPTVEKTFYKSAHHTDSVRLATQPNPEYKGKGGLTLVDGQKGAPNFRDGKWLGYKDNPMEAVLYFKQPQSISSVTFSCAVNIGNYIMPPYKIEVWGGDNVGKLRLLNSLTPTQPIMDKPGYLAGYKVAFIPIKATYFKVVVKPVAVLPSWHRGKGDKGWAFVDELFLN